MTTVTIPNAPGVGGSTTTTVPTPTNPIMAAPTGSVPSGLPSAFRPNINTMGAILDAKIQILSSLMESVAGIMGYSLVSGGAITTGTGLSVNVAAFTALVGTMVNSASSQIVGGFPASLTSYLFLRQDGTWSIPASGSSTPPLVIDGHGQYLLFATVTTNTTLVTGITPLARNSIQNNSEVIILATDPATSISGDAWFNTTSNQFCVNVSGTIYRVFMSGINEYLLHVVASSANYTVPVDPFRNYMIVCVGTNTITLPDATLHQRPIVFKAEGTAISVVPNGSQTIEGAGSMLMANSGTDRKCATLYPDGISKWYIFNDVLP